MSTAAAKERLYLFDTTLRDGAQTNGVDFTLHDKQRIAGMLDELGIDYVEGGYPGANPTDTEFFAAKPKLNHARFTAFGMTRRAGRSASNDPGLAGLLEAKADAICFVAKSSAYQVRVALETTNEENLASIRDSVKAAKAAGREVMLDCEHFFDGYKENAEFALACAKAGYDSGARWVVLCDTNGGTMPHEVETIVTEMVKHIPGDHVGIHAHNDTEQAVANSLAAVRAGARQIQGTLNGLGERCGNANLCSLIPTLRLKREFADCFEIGVSPDWNGQALPTKRKTQSWSVWSRNSRSARPRAMPTSPPTRRSICWHGARLARCRNISGSNSSMSMSNSATTPMASASRWQWRW